MSKRSHIDDVVTSIKQQAFEGLVRYEGDGLQKAMSDATALDCSGDPSQTQQSFADETDINNIVATFERTGFWPENTGFEPRYGDTTLLPEFQEAQNLIAQANNSFSLLDAHVRAYFDNSPEKFVAFLSEPGHDAELRAPGLLNPLPQEAPGMGSEASPDGDSSAAPSAPKGASKAPEGAKKAPSE